MNKRIREIREAWEERRAKLRAAYRRKVRGQHDAVRERIEDVRKKFADADATSRKGIAFIARFEGYPPTQPYNDPVGYCTAGFGHLLHYSACTEADRIRWGRLTRDEALEMLADDVQPFAAAVLHLIEQTLTQQELDALTSFAFNLGTGALGDSTLRRRLNSNEGNTKKGRSKIYREELPKWTMAGGQQLPGLVTRRAAEVKLATEGKYGL